MITTGCAQPEDLMGLDLGGILDLLGEDRWEHDHIDDMAVRARDREGIEGGSRGIGEVSSMAIWNARAMEDHWNGRNMGQRFETGASGAQPWAGKVSELGLCALSFGLLGLGRRAQERKVLALVQAQERARGRGAGGGGGGRSARGGGCWRRRREKVGPGELGVALGRGDGAEQRRTLAGAAELGRLGVGEVLGFGGRCCGGELVPLSVDWVGQRGRRGYRRAALVRRVHDFGSGNWRRTLKPELLWALVPHSPGVDWIDTVEAGRVVVD
ncbi:hypothetical protein BJ508DRAFT_313250 [Ascobolus immersus RN42]|uniref:Uncharacterized protein n=1 Tax=Ascobolus immersus RN42 TaxID=1160509 RepID=A0A3N4HJH6_ASCIM|nr:hypothetical protein BJ508DRAFT_313250 [Ascobolus immersus RN42]